MTLPISPTSPLNVLAMHASTHPLNLPLVPLEHVHQEGKLAEEGQVDPQVHKGVAREVVKSSGGEALWQMEGVLGAPKGE